MKMWSGEERENMPLEGRADELNTFLMRLMKAGDNVAVSRIISIWGCLLDLFAELLTICGYIWRLFWNIRVY